MLPPSHGGPEERVGYPRVFPPGVPRCFPMASVCEVCGKQPRFGMRLSHSHRRTKRRWNPNVQKVRAIVNGTPKRVHVCTSCLKAGKVQKP